MMVIGIDGDSSRKGGVVEEHDDIGTRPVDEELRRRDLDIAIERVMNSCRVTVIQGGSVLNVAKIYSYCDGIVVEVDGGRSEEARDKRETCVVCGERICSWAPRAPSQQTADPGASHWLWERLRNA